MKIISKLTIILGFCAASLGAASLGKPANDDSVSPDTGLAILICGVISLVLGGLLSKKEEQADGAAEESASRLDFVPLLEEIRCEIHELASSLDKLSAEDLTQRIDSLLKRQYFDLIARHEELASLLGFSKYAEIWDGVASAERLLSRAWSMATDGYLEEALQEIPRARTHIERACDAMAKS